LAAPDVVAIHSVVAEDIEEVINEIDDGGGVRTVEGN
jgi:hypothetical protein